MNTRSLGILAAALSLASAVVLAMAPTFSRSLQPGTSLADRSSEPKLACLYSPSCP